VKKGLCSSAEARVRAAAMSALRSRWGPCVRRDDLLEISICDSLAATGFEEMNYFPAFTAFSIRRASTAQ